ncbi:LysR family transcriptional regulator [Crenobacter sp. SG2303]|uniref:LysR family transcriptional regulator n=1 Tax=Crenobacter oryzisoli TaxID=3056844 RepID=A0ABT7XSN0_9NEIS|nr:LysR family transcriptional regulator [Crenobacter sp. SG2303]MDN0076800.1 LysR family transcriptional regulator [Crenobacter sp. SG2303]
MNLNHLRHLIALAEYQSFRKAADALCLTQPALSRSIQALEQELNVRLIDRHGKRNTLTAYGQQVVASARRIVFEAAELHRGIFLLQEGQLGSISIGFGPTPAAILMTPFLTLMASCHPKVQVKLARGSVDMLTQSLLDETVDIIVIDRRALTAVEDLLIEPLPPVRGGFICRTGHPLLAHPHIDLAMLRQFPVASMPLSDEIIHDLVTELGPEAHPSRLMTINCEDLHGMLDVAEATDAIFFGIFASAKARISAGKLQEIKLHPHFERMGQYALVSLARRSESPTLKLFRDFAHEHFHD